MRRFTQLLEPNFQLSLSAEDGPARVGPYAFAALVRAGALRETEGTFVLDRSAFNELLRRLFHVEPSNHAGEGPPSSMYLGQVASEERAVFFCYHPAEPAFSTWIARCETSRRRARVLVPTRQHINVQTGALHPMGAGIEIVALDEVLQVENGEVSLVGGPPAVSIAPMIALLQLPATAAWVEVEFFRLNETTLSVRYAAGTAIRVTAADLGMAHAESRDAKMDWLLLVAVCEGRGRATRAALGNLTHDAMKKRASRLARALRRAFGIDGSPLTVDARGEAVVAYFRAHAESIRESRRNGTTP